MSFIGSHCAKPRSGGVTVVLYLGRTTSDWLNYAESGSYTAADTALTKTASVTVTCTLNGITKTDTISNLVTDANRGIVSFDFDGLSSGVYDWSATTDSHTSIKNTRTGRAKVWHGHRLNAFLTSCNTGDMTQTASILKGLSVNSGFADDDYPATEGLEPINGTYPQIARQCVDRNSDVWIHNGDWVYMFLSSSPIWGPPLSLTDAGTDTPVSGLIVDNYTTQIVGSAVTRAGTQDAQLLHFKYEEKIRSPEMKMISDAGIPFVCLPDDNEFFQDFDHCWWRQIKDLTGLSAQTLNPNDATTNNPFADANHSALCGEMATFYKACKDAWQLWIGDYNPPAITGISAEVPWIISDTSSGLTAGVDYTAADYTPMCWMIDHPRASILGMSFVATADIIPIGQLDDLEADRNDWVGIDDSGDSFLNNGTPRDIVSPFGATNETNFLAQLDAELTSKEFVAVVTSKQWGTVGQGNQDGLDKRCPAWLDNWIAVDIPARSQPLAVIGGDKHIPLACKTDDFVMVSPCPISLGPNTNLSSQLDGGGTNGTTDVTILATYKHPTEGGTGNAYDQVRQAWAAFVVQDDVANLFCKDARGGYVSNNYQFTSSAITSVGKTVIEVASMAKVQITNMEVGADGSLYGAGTNFNGNELNTKYFYDDFPLKVYDVNNAALLSLATIHLTSSNDVSGVGFKASESSAFTAFDATYDSGSNTVSASDADIDTYWPDGLAITVTPTPNNWTMDLASLKSVGCRIDFDNDTVYTDDYAYVKTITAATTATSFELKVTVSGTATGGTTTTLVDSGGGFGSGSEWVGYRVRNITDGSYGIVTSHTDTELTCSAGFTGGTDNTPANLDEYKLGVYDLSMTVTDPSASTGGGFDIIDTLSGDAAFSAIFND